MRRFLFYIAVLLSLFAVSHALGQEKPEMEDAKPLYELSDKELDKKLGIDEKTETVKDYIGVIGFHRFPACSSCELMSKYVYETVTERFADELKGKRIVLRYRNFEDEKNAELVKKLGIRSPSLAILQFRGGKPAKAKLAATIWSLAAEKEKFMDQVEEDVKWYLTDFEEEQE